MPLPVATLGVTGGTVDVLLKDKFGEDSMLAANWVDRSAPPPRRSSEHSACRSLRWWTDRRVTCWHATAVGIDESDVVVELRASPGSDVIKRALLSQESAG